MKLICFPHAGGFSFYYNFFRRIDGVKKEDLFLYEYPGRGIKAKEQKAQSIMEIAENAAKEIVMFTEKDNFCIFGHSMGAFVAYETEGILERKYGKKAEKLIVSGQHPPKCFDPHHYSFSNTNDLDRYLMSLGGFPEEIRTNQEIFEALFGQCRYDIQLLQRYRPSENVIVSDTVVVCGDSDLEVGDTEHLRRWNESTENLMEIKIFSGTHFYMKEQEKDFLFYISNVIKGETNR